MVASLLIDGQELTAKQICAVANLLGFEEIELADINANERLRTHIINELLDRHGTGRILFRNTRDSVQGFFWANQYPLSAASANGMAKYTLHPGQIA